MTEFKGIVIKIDFNDRANPQIGYRKTAGITPFEIMGALDVLKNMIASEVKFNKKLDIRNKGGKEDDEENI